MAVATSVVRKNSVAGLPIAASMGTATFLTSGAGTAQGVPIAIDINDSNIRLDNIGFASITGPAVSATQFWAIADVACGNGKLTITVVPILGTAAAAITLSFAYMAI